MQLKKTIAWKGANLAYPLKMLYSFKHGNDSVARARHTTLL